MSIIQSDGSNIWNGNHYEFEHERRLRLSRLPLPTPKTKTGSHKKIIDDAPAPTVSGDE